ncbi:phosphatase PAP2 family protein [[Acholeplasma] multilocale]|uniref:phosphatase PAP2 family protein n=1 Tax=[Acholeplasma] multilocale TaxID=264638 RepID=UPI00047C68FD|nr:phosphatase PAP2 family protein [[Acholeplasma] multilocale]
MRLKIDRQRLIEYSVFSIIGILLFVIFMVGTFKDLQIAEAVANTSSWYGKFFDIFGQMTVSIPVISLIVLFFIALNKKGIIINKYLEYSIYSIAIIIFVITGWMDIISEKNSDKTKIISAVINTILFLSLYSGIIYYLKFKKPEFIYNDSKLLEKVVTALLFVIATFVMMQLLKFVFSRPRPRTVMADIDEYREWWNIHYTEHWKINKSFPSGHSTSAISILALALVWDRRTTRYYSTIAIAIATTVIVATSRMVITAHFLTDVTGATIFSFIWFGIFNWLRNDKMTWVDKIIKKKEARNG